MKMISDPRRIFYVFLFPTTFMLRVSFSPAPECVIVVLLESSFSDPRAAQSCCCCTLVVICSSIFSFLFVSKLFTFILISMNPILGIVVSGHYWARAFRCHPG